MRRGGYEPPRGMVALLRDSGMIFRWHGFVRAGAAHAYIAMHCGAS